MRARIVLRKLARNVLMSSRAVRVLRCRRRGGRTTGRFAPDAARREVEATWPRLAPDPRDLPAADLAAPHFSFVARWVRIP